MWSLQSEALDWMWRAPRRARWARLERQARMRTHPPPLKEAVQEVQTRQQQQQQEQEQEAEQQSMTAAVVGMMLLLAPRHPPHLLEPAEG